MLLYCNTEDCVWLQVRMQHRYSHASPGLTCNPSPVWLSMSSSAVLLSSKSVVPRVPRSLAGLKPEKDSDGAVRLFGCSRAHSSLMAGSCFSMNRLISTISSGQALWGRPRYDLKVMLDGLQRFFIFSAVWLPNMKGTRGSASPWHCRMCMSLLALLAAAWGKDLRRGSQQLRATTPPSFCWVVRAV